MFVIHYLVKQSYYHKLMEVVLKMIVHLKTFMTLSTIIYERKNYFLLYFLIVTCPLSLIINRISDTSFNYLKAYAK